MKNHIRFFYELFLEWQVLGEKVKKKKKKEFK